MPNCWQAAGSRPDRLPVRAGQVAARLERIFAYPIRDRLVPAPDLLLDRGMMGDEVIDLGAIRAMIGAAGHAGPQEVEIFSKDNWRKRPGDVVVSTRLERFAGLC